MKSYNLVLSGGGARGVAHLGIIQYLEEINFKISGISGTSAGALYGAFYAAGYKPKQILKIAKEAKLFNLPNLLFGKSGLFNMDAFEEVILDHIPHNSFEKLNIPLTVATTDIINNKTIYFSSGTLSKPLLASSCIPLVFEPINYVDTFLLDGGILNNFPVEPFSDKNLPIIGIHVNSVSSKIEHLHMKDMLDRSFHCALSQSVYSKIKKCELFIEPPDMSQFGMFDFNKDDEIFEYAYQYAKSIHNEIQAIQFI